jgi:hypothetical protein
LNGQVRFGGLGTADFVGYTSHKDYTIEWFVRGNDGNPNANPLKDGKQCFYSGYVYVT